MKINRDENLPQLFANLLFYYYNDFIIRLLRGNKNLKLLSYLHIINKTHPLLYDQAAECGKIETILLSHACGAWMVDD